MAASVPSASAGVSSRSHSRSTRTARTCAVARAWRDGDAAPSAPLARWCSRAAMSAGMPSPVSAVVTRTRDASAAGATGPCRAARPCGTSIARSCAAVRCAPGRSPLFTTTMSATSSSPALIACTSSPISGASRTTVVSAAAATSTSLWPVPTVSSSTTSNPAASSTRRRHRGRRREPAGVPARRHRADEHARVAGVGLHPHAVAEERAAGDRRRGIDGNDRDRAARPPASRRSAPPRAWTCRRRAVR